MSARRDDAGRPDYDHLDPCQCGHIREDHGFRSPFHNACLVEDCECETFRDYDQSDDSDAWSGGFAENH